MNRRNQTTRKNANKPAGTPVACCCRGCLNKWYRIPKNVELTPAQQEKIVNLLMAWIEKQMKNTPIIR